MELPFPLSVGNKYLVRWKDSGTHHADGWQTPEEIVRSAEIESVTSIGYLFQITLGAIYLGQTWDDERKTFFGTQVIALSNIEEVDEVYLSPLGRET